MQLTTSVATALWVFFSLSSIAKGEENIDVRGPWKKPTTTILLPPRPSITPHCPPLPCSGPIIERSCIKGRCIEKRFCVAEDIVCPLD
ncbi:hypothetical protein B0H19DRAFT_487567 [Mycena capillaripes]|nr:hypothetical protein B0H19DRAFT_487567 [Mycena capillaripes]